MSGEGCKQGRSGRGGGAPFTLPGAVAHYPPDLRLEPVHLDIALRVDIEARTCEGTVTATVRANDAGARGLSLHAVGFEEAAARAVEGGHVETSYDGRALALTWSEPFAHGEERRVAIDYRVVEPATGLFFSSPSAEDPSAPLFAVTDHETERARHWLPCVDLPAVRPTLRFALRASAELTVLANGALEGREEHDDGTATTRYRLDAPCPSYLTCFAIGDFARWDGESVDGVPVAAFAPRPFTEAEVERTFGPTPAMLRWMTRRLGRPYPYPKYFQFAARGIGGAMENISLVSWDDRFVLDETLALEERHLIDIVNVHEMAHSWFGDHVVCRDYAHAWLKESWATYMETCWLEDTEGADARDYDLWACAQSYFRESNERYRRPIVTRRFNTSFDMYDHHLYPGGAIRLHMLRCLLGDEVFWASVRTYLERYGGRVVETDDFRRCLEERSGRSLGRFFDQWLHSPGHPKLKVSFNHDAAKGEGTFVLEQTQVDAKAGVPCFDIEVELAWVVEGTMHRRTVPMDRPRVVAVVPMPADPEQVRIDPDGRLVHELDFDPGRERLRRQLAAPDVRGRIQAGIALARSGRRVDVERLGAAFEAEPFWGVRVEWAAALGDAASEPALDVLLALARSHEAPRTLAPLFRALGRYRDARVVAALGARLDAGLPHRAREAALEALGAQREEAPLERLADAAATPGWGGFAQAGALRALGASRREEALDLLARHATPGASPTVVRPHAVTALGSLARVSRGRPRERAIELLVDRLRDPEAKVRAAAAAALGEARAVDQVDAIEAYRARLSAQEQVRVDRILAGLRATDGEGAKRAADRIEELEGQLRKLSERVDALEARTDREG